MRKFSIAGVAVLVFAAMAAAALAQAPETQTTFRIDAKVLPNKAGTPKDPQGVKLKASVKFFTPEGVEKPIFTGGYARFPRHGNFNGRDFPKCSKRTLDRRGPDACPKGSKIGQGRGSAYADTVITYPKVIVFNAGQKLAYAYVTLYNPALVREAIPIHIQTIASGPWKYKVSLKIPQVLQVVAGIPIAARSFKGEVGRGNLIETTSCPANRRWPYELYAEFSSGTPFTYRDSSPCRPSGR